MSQPLLDMAIGHQMTWPLMRPRFAYLDRKIGPRLTDPCTRTGRITASDTCVDRCSPFIVSLLVSLPNRRLFRRGRGDRARSFKPLSCSPHPYIMLPNFVLCFLSFWAFARAQTPIQTFWPGAAPLAVRSPYLNVWQTDINANDYPEFWVGSVRSFHP